MFLTVAPNIDEESIEEDSDYLRESSFSSNDSEEFEDDFRYVLPQLGFYVHRIDLNINNNNDNIINVVGNPIDNDTENNSVLLSSSEINSKFPLSLKYLARINVKNSMLNFSKTNVQKLNFLPRELQNFLVFQDEIDEIKRFSDDNETTRNNLD